MEEVEQVWKCVKLLEKYIRETQPMEEIERIENERIEKNLSVRREHGEDRRERRERLLHKTKGYNERINAL